MPKPINYDVFRTILLSYFHEWKNYDFRYLKSILMFFFIPKFFFHYYRKDILGAINTLGKYHRAGWPGSESATIFILRNFFIGKQEIINSLYEQKIEAVPETPSNSKFFDDPTLLFEKIFIVVRKSSTPFKGIIIIKYNGYFPLVCKLFNIQEILSDYHLVFEPSWAGYCDPDILMMEKFGSSVYFMAYETRDSRLLKRLDCNLLPVRTGSNWWVDYRSFNVDSAQRRDIDLVVIAKWSYFKRYYFLLRLIAKLKSLKTVTSVALVGYTGDQELKDITNLLKYFDLKDITTVHEWLSPQEVSDMLCRSKINILWSRFEGDKRSIVEGMFCDTPCILREGSNYGQKYEFINQQTGRWANEKDFVTVITDLLTKLNDLSPREYVENHHNCKIAYKTIYDTIYSHSGDLSEYFEADETCTKINELHEMKYMNEDAKLKFVYDYSYLSLNMK
jgi:hypothetical protein